MELSTLKKLVTTSLYFSLSEKSQSRYRRGNHPDQDLGRHLVGVDGLLGLFVLVGLPNNVAADLALEILKEMTKQHYPAPSAVDGVTDPGQ